MNKNARLKLSKSSPAVSTKKESEESERFTRAMQKMKSSGVRDQRLADKLLVQAAGASLSCGTATTYPFADGPKMGYLGNRH